MWMHTISVGGCGFEILFDGQARLCMDQDQVSKAVVAGKMQTILNWFVENAEEFCVAMNWNDGWLIGYDDDQEPYDVQTVVMVAKSRFATEDTRQIAKEILQGTYWMRARRQTEITATTKDKSAKKIQGFVYILHSGGSFKIGRTNDLGKRITQISPIMPHPVELVHSIKSEDCLELESRLHEHFSSKRLNGEWFALTQEDVEYIKSL